MSKPRKSPVRFAWKSACKTCTALFQWCYSAIVLLLVAATIFAGYVATLDDIPVPRFIIREIQDQLKTKRIVLEMEGVRFQPNGRIIFDKPELYSTELGSTIISAEFASTKIKLSHLIFGDLAIDEIRIAGGEFILPAMVTPSGEPTTAVSSINLEATLRAQQWRIHFANCAIGNLKLSLAGRLDDSLISIPKPKPDAPKPSITQAILKLAPQMARLQKELNRLDYPYCNIDLDVENRKQTARVQVGADKLTVDPNTAVFEFLLQAQYKIGNQLTATVAADRVELPQGITARYIRLEADWQDSTPIEQPLPDHIRASATQINYRNFSLPSLVAEIFPGQEIHSGSLQIALPESPIVANLRHTVSTKSTEIDLQATIDAATIAAINPIASDIAKQDLGAMATLGKAVDIHAVAKLDPSFKPLHAEAFVQAGAVTLLKAGVDYAAVHTLLTGKQIDVEEIRLRSGKQEGVIKVGYNLDTLLRRVLVEGSFDPTLINAWFKPWWGSMWEGMTFPEEGMLTYLDSKALFKRPDTVFVTGIGYVRDIDIRGLEVDELRTRIFSIFHYVDLYDLELSTIEGQQALGEIQFHMDRDKRDEKDKLTGIWIQALSTLDVKKAPSIIWEIAEDAQRILEPYCYDLPPFIEARSSSVRHEDEYLNDIDLVLETENNFSFYGFPFDSLDAFVHIGDDIIDIPRAEARLGGGLIQASAFIVGDELDVVGAELSGVGFGEALNAANTYFAQDGSETAESFEPERLLAFGGEINADFQGVGIVGDPLSFLGDGEFEITEADFGSLRLFGLLSMALEITPLRFSTLKFSEAAAQFRVERELVHFDEGKIQGSVAAVDTTGNYSIATDSLDFAAKLFPFRNSKVPLISPLVNLPLNIFSNAFEVSVTGTFSEPQLSLFNPSTKEKIEVSNPRDHRPGRK